MIAAVANLTLTSAGTMLGAIDPLWWILAFFAFAFFDWLNKKRQKHEAESKGDESSLRTPPVRPPRTTTPPAAPRPTETSNWEDELRRLLGGEPPPAPAPPTAPPPLRPVIISQAPRPAAPPPIIVEHVPRPAPTVPRTAPHPFSSILRRTHVEEATQAPSVELVRLEQSATAFQRASQLHETVGERLRHVDEMTERHLATAPSVRHRDLSPEVAQVLSQFRNPRSARLAVIASIILEKPKALESQ